MPKSPGRAGLLVVFLTVLIDLVGFGMVLPLLPVYARHYTVDESGWVLGLLMASFSAMQFIFAPLWGRLSDRVGRRPVLIVGLVGSTVFYALFGVSAAWESLALMFVSRVGAGIAGATIATAQAYIADVTTLETRARGMALIGAAFGLGFTFGPLIAAAGLLSADGLATSPWPGYAAAAMSGGALVLAIFALPESLGPNSQPAGRHWFDLATLRQALATPSVGPLLLVTFLSIVSFGGFEQTLALALKDESGRFAYSEPRLLLVFAYLGLVLSLVQGGIVRRLATRWSEARMALTGASIAAMGFLYLVWASYLGSLGHLLGAAAVEITGFAFLTPSLNALISRRTDPTQQGGILGVAQSVSSLARIAAPLVAVPLFHSPALTGSRGPELPYVVSFVLNLIGVGLVAWAVRGGRDFPAEPKGPSPFAH